MGNIKDKLNDPQTETVTLTPAEIQFIKAQAAAFQRSLDELQNRFVTEYLKQVAVQRFEYGLADELGFTLDLQKLKNNLTITRQTPEK